MFRLIKSTSVILFCGFIGGASASAVEVVVDKVTAQSDDLKLTISGVVYADSEYVMSSRVASYVEYYVQEGEQVSKGDVLLKLDTYDLKQEQQRAQLMLQKQKRELKYIRWQGEQASKLESKSYLSKMEKKDVFFHIDKLQLDIKQSQLALERTEEYLSRSLIYAPVDGVVIKSSVKYGQHIQVGEEVLRLVNNDNKKRIKALLPIKDAKHFDKKQIGTMVSSKGDTVEVEPLSIGLYSDEEKQAVPVYFNFDDNNSAFSVGQRINIQLPRKNLGYVKVNRDSIFIEGDKTFVWKVSKDGKAIKEPVVVKIDMSSHALVSANLTEEDVVVTRGSIMLADGMEVTYKLSGTQL